MKEEIKNYISEYLEDHVMCVLSSHIKNSKKDYFELIKSATLFLDENSKPSERIYCYIHDITEKCKCINCNEKIMNFKNLTIGYCRYCKNCVNCKGCNLCKNCENYTYKEFKNVVS